MLAYSMKRGSGNVEVRHCWDPRTNGRNADVKNFVCSNDRMEKIPALSSGQNHRFPHHVEDRLERNYQEAQTVMARS